uniref:Uncharacterized protein n=1 Tax=Romanomermis culicivorax TaxID=13658 RepID=A0A915L848_ROMCU
MVYFEIMDSSIFTFSDETERSSTVRNVQPENQLSVEKYKLHFCGKRPMITSNRAERNENFSFLRLRSADCTPFHSVGKMQMAF